MLFLNEIYRVLEHLGLKFIRYADDFNEFVRRRKAGGSVLKGPYKHYDST